MNLTVRNRTLTILFLMVAAIAMGFFFYSWLNRVYPGAPSAKKAATPAKSFSRPFHDIRGFNYSHYDGRKIAFTIGAARFRLEKKKIGFLRVALMREVTLDNAVIDVFLPEKQAGLTEKPESALACLLKDGALSGLDTGGAGEISIRPVMVRILSKKEAPLSTVMAEEAILRIKDKTMVFSGNVIIQSGLSRLKSEHAKVYLSTGLVEPGSGYTLDPPGMPAKGKDVFTDVFLTSMHGKIRGK